MLAVHAKIVCMYVCSIFTACSLIPPYTIVGLDITWRVVGSTVTLKAAFT